MSDWVVAEDIGRRLAELRECLGESQRAFAKRFGRTWKRVSAWENGQSAPPKGVLAQAAERAGWDTQMFAAGGPYPKQALECARMPQDRRTERGPGRRQEDVELRASALRKDAARLDAILKLIRTYREMGRPASPDVLEEWEAIARANSLPENPPAGPRPGPGADPGPG